MTLFPTHVLAVSLLKKVHAHVYALSVNLAMRLLHVIVACSSCRYCIEKILEQVGFHWHNFTRTRLTSTQSRVRVRLRVLLENLSERRLFSRVSLYFDKKLSLPASQHAKSSEACTFLGMRRIWHECNRHFLEARQCVSPGGAIG